MQQVLFRIPIGDGIPVYGYGLMLVLGFLAATQLAKFLARRIGLDGEVFVNAAVIALIAGVVGARLSHVLENFSQYTNPQRSAWENLKDAANLTSGGLTFYGGFLLAFPVLVWYAWKKKIPVRRGMDIVAPCLMVGLGFGRIGCYLNGCCWGAQCDSAVSVVFPYHSPPYMDQVERGEIDIARNLSQPKPTELPLDVVQGWSTKDRPILKSPATLDVDPKLSQVVDRLHSHPVLPAQLLSAFTAFLLAALLLAYFTVPHTAGRVFAVMLILEGGTRFLLELIRSEPAVAGSMSISMIIGLGLVALGAVLWVAFGRARHLASQPALA